MIRAGRQRTQVSGYVVCPGFAILLSTVLSAQVIEADIRHTEDAYRSPVQCGMYMGESTIPGAGLGIFTGVDLKVDDKVGDGDICIPIIDYSEHNDQPVFNPFADYVWGGEIMGMKTETGIGNIEAYCPGLDCVINCNMALLNVAKATPVFDDSGMHRSTNPGTGAISPYHNGTTTVIRDVPAGGELFKSYGESWFTSRSIFDHIPLPRNYEIAQRILNRFGHLIGRFRDTGTGDWTARDLYSLLVEFRSMWGSRTVNAFPLTFEDAQLAVATDIGTTHQPAATRTIEWLDTHAKCVDHIVPKKSTLPSAGRGAFARRRIPEGTLITGTPLHHLPKRDLVRMYEIKDGVAIKGDDWGGSDEAGDNGRDGDDDDDDDEYEYDNHDDNDDDNGGQPYNYQVLLNYCFGHKQSPVLLCPYGVGINYINHNQTLANVRIRWAKHGTSNQNDEWLRLSPDDLAKHISSGLGFDYIAISDIEEGEELFLDYGDDWEEAWEKHRSGWEDGMWGDTEKYLNSHDWNEVMRDTPLRTMDECFYDPYPSNLEVRCHYALLDHDDWTDDASLLEWETLNDYGYPCEVMERVSHDDGSLDYVVRITKEPKDRWDHYDLAEKFVVEHVPRNAIKFGDVAYTTDLHLRPSFRKEIALPDDMLPESWKY